MGCPSQNGRFETDELVRSRTRRIVRATKRDEVDYWEGDGNMKLKIAIAASLLMISVQTASAQYYNNNFYYQYYWGAPAEEDNLAYTKALRDKARKERQETGKSDVGARLRLQQECTRAIERGVEDGVRRSYGCGD